MYIIKIEEEYWGGWKWDRKQKNKKKDPHRESLNQDYKDIKSTPISLS